MERFVKLEIYGSDGVKMWRTFNLRYIRHFDEESCRMMLQGAKVAVLVERASMKRLIEAATTDVEAMSERMAYLQRRVDACGLTGVLQRLCEALERPLWRRLL